ncbi:MAG: copper transporter [Actinomycetaceae bacterium]|nr:copper transporter [Arcanobacterium sp.]MDD7504405.1 copper transporter [Actinomycetaceae bacterium]MDY6143593.1 copper transporter [Arcanobacterium sp.]
MIDFRYHIVSLVAVFLALSVGVILGAGPLQNSIGNALTGQVSSLSESNQALKAENTELKTQIQGQDKAWDVAAPALITDALKDTNIAIVAFPGASADDVDTVTSAVQDAGGTVASSVSITPEWTASSQTAFRTTFAEQISAYLPEGSEASDTNTILSTALVQLLTGNLEEENTATLQDLMASADTAMIEFAQEPSAPAQLVLFVAGDLSAPEAQADAQANSDEAAQRDYDMKTYTNLVKFVSGKVPTEVAGYANSPEDLLTAIRSGGIDASTVDSIDTAVGRINVALAASSELANDKVDLGFEAGATLPLGQRAIVTPAAEEAPDGADNTESAPAQE